MRNVSIPFKRESGFKESISKGGYAPEELSFNSLQTGKWIQRLKRCTVVSPHEVSIPFKRESGFKGCQVCFLIYIIYSFNSLQTGKWIQSVKKYEHAAVIISFNSLQTGKWIQS